MLHKVDPGAPVKKLVSIVCPMLNEQANVGYFYTEVSQALAGVADLVDFEFVFVDDGSTDQTLNLLEGLSKDDPRITIIKLSRNYGFQPAIMTGYAHCKGDAAIQIDSDLEDPPEIMCGFVKQWLEGHKIVYGIREKRQESWLKEQSRKIFYRFMKKISDQDLPLDAGDFMLIDRKIIDVLKSYRSSNLYLRGTIYSMGFSRVGIGFARNKRKFGTSKFPLVKMISLAWDGIISQSIIPLRLATLVGFVVILGCLGLSGFYLLEYLFDPTDIPPGWMTLTLITLFCLGMNAMFFGIIGEYIARIYRQTRNEPVSTVEWVHLSTHHQRAPCLTEV